MLIIDRFEKNLAVCVDTENGSITNISVDKLPPKIQEGDILTYINGVYGIDKNSAERRRKMLSKKMNDLFNKNR